MTDAENVVGIAYDENDWAYEPESGLYLATRGGYVYREREPTTSTWSWPEANEPPIPGSGWYVERHPTRYTWREDVEAWARHLVDNYNVWCNTYYDHPEGWWRTEDSLDVWGPGGRGDAVDPADGQVIFDELFNDPGLPNIDWCIWRAWLWSVRGGWEAFGTDDFSWHYDHIHMTFI